MRKILCLFCAMFMFSSVAYGAVVNKVAAVVNGSMISVFDVQQSALPQLKKAGLDPKNDAHKAKIQQIYTEVLDNMVLEMLLVGEATKNGITTTAQEVDAEIARMMEQSRLSKEDFEKQLEKEGLTPGLLRGKVEKTILRQKLTGMMVGRKIVVTPEEVQAYYDENKDSLKTRDDLQLALLVYPDDVNPAKYATEFAKNSSNFEEVAQKISIGPSKENGGRLGSVPLDKLDPRLASLIKSLPQGGVTPVIVLNGKKAQFKVVKKSSGGGVMTFEEAKPMIENILRQPRLQERFEEYVKQLRSKSVIDLRM